jgi:hypothetical protein
LLEEREEELREVVVVVDERDPELNIAVMGLIISIII